MTRFYLHLLRAGNELIADDEGIDLPDLSAARREAMQSARELLCEAIKGGRPEILEAFVITDEAGQTLDTVPLTAVFPKPFRKSL
jgi:hypothetical protein